MPENRLMSWITVPDGSTLEIQATGSDQNFNVSWIEIIQPGTSRVVPPEDALLTYKEILARPKGYAVTVAIAFLSENPTTVTITATVTKPGGMAFGGPRAPHICTGVKGETDSVMVIAVTKQ